MRWTPRGYGGERRPPEKVKQNGWQEQGLLAVSVDDQRLSWPEREFIRQIGEICTASRKRGMRVMPDILWTPSLIEERFVEAADVMKRLPDVRVPGYFNTWPKMVVEFADRVGQEPPRLRLGPPAPDAISRMEETLSWLAWLDPLDGKIVWLRASGERWKAICWQIGLARTAANQHWLYALCMLAWKLNGRQPRRRSRQHVIELTRAAK